MKRKTRVHKKKVKTTPPSLYYRWWIFAKNEHTIIIIIIKWWKKWKCEKNLLHLVIIIRSMQRYIYCYCVLGIAINWSRRRVVDIVVMLAKLESAGRVSWMPVATRHYTNSLHSGTLAQFRFLSLHWAELFFLSFFFFRRMLQGKQHTLFRLRRFHWIDIWFISVFWKNLNVRHINGKCNTPGRNIETPNATYFVRKMCHTKRTRASSINN